MGYHVCECMNLETTHQMWKAEETVWTDQYLLLEPRYPPWRRRGNGGYQQSNNSGSYFCLCYFNADCDCIEYEGITKENWSSLWIYNCLFSVKCTLGSDRFMHWLGLAEPSCLRCMWCKTVSSNCRSQYAVEVLVTRSSWKPKVKVGSEWPHRDQGAPTLTSLWETDYKKCPLLCILLIYPFLE